MDESGRLVGEIFQGQPASQKQDETPVLITTLRKFLLILGKQST